MYDERTGQLDHQWATYAYAREEGIEYGMQRGIQQGMQQGMERGKIGTIVNLVKEGIIAKEVGAKKLNITEKEFESYLQEM
ncbi:hypothetical protein [uncultured Gemella sp.]|uniref:hypothetical protein n=1 Tax=uncultured Gemella sp. TaxID=254352 RepID=UPI0028D26E6F|nr:hypothetical protein [uncultured Gemella sp.]